MSAKESLGPVPSDERVDVLDSLRGFAIFGILMINISVFSGYTYLSAEAQSELMMAEWNGIFDFLHNVLFSGKFYTLFSLLFGISFAIQYMRFSDSEKSFTLHFSRRLFFLFLIGVIHLWGIWFSDILVIYALCGYVLLLFKKVSGRWLLFWAVVILLIPALNAWHLQTSETPYTNYVYEFLNEQWYEVGLPLNSNEAGSFEMSDVATVIQSGDWRTVLSFNYIGPLLRGYVILLDGRFFKVIGIFILGFWFGKQILLHSLHRNKKSLSMYALGGLLIGLPVNIYTALGWYPGISEGNFPLVKEMAEPFALVGLTTFYVAAFMLLYHTSFKKVLDKMFNAVGKTALSNYVLQSIIGIALLYEIGLGLGSELGAAPLTLLVFLIFAVQAVLSSVFLKSFRFGPLEWIWRILTYGKWIKNRKN